MSGARIELGGTAVLAPNVDRVCVVYDEVFSEPPFFWRPDESLLHRQRLNSLLRDPSFGGALAWDDKDLVGFAYGVALAPDTQRWSRLIGSGSGDLTVEWPGRTFLLFDFAVRGGFRGRGVGRQLHDRLLAGRGEDRATLTVQPTAADTKEIYRRWGWRMVGQMEGGPSAAAPMFDVFVRDRLDDLR